MNNKRKIKKKKKNYTIISTSVGDSLDKI
jgi:hypothetical protein